MAFVKLKNSQIDPDWHIARHKMLHKNLDELMADFINHTGKLPSQATIMELAAWSNKQVQKPEVKETGLHSG